MVAKAVEDAVLGQTTQTTRRCSIFEADGTTPWAPGVIPRVKDGSVTLDYARDERRNFDLVLDNSDHAVSHNSANGLWYDKVVKIYRGFNFTNLKAKPSVVIIGTSPLLNTTLSLTLRQAGFTDLTFISDISATVPDNLLNYDIVIGWAVDADLTAAQAQLLLACYQAGQSVFSASNFASTATVPLIATSLTRTSASAWDVQPPTTDTPFRGFLSAYNAPNTSGETIPATVRASAKVAALSTYSSALRPTAIWETNTAGGKWFHYHPKLSTVYTPASNVARMLNFIRGAMSWLYSYGSTKSWETQLGEFYIDKISEPNFPHEISLSGRDATKKLMFTKIDTAVSYASGTPADYLIQAIAANAGITRFKMGSNTTTSATLTFDRTTSRWDIIKAIAQNVNIEVFFDAYGYLVTRQFLDPTLSPLMFTLSTGNPRGNLVSFTKTSDDSQLYNYIVVSGDPAADAITGGTSYQAISANNAPSSNTRIGKIGQRSYYYTSSFFTSNDQCQAYADRLLSIMALENYQVDFSSLMFPWWDVGEIVGWDDPDPNSDAPARYLLTNLSFPLGLGPMSASAKRVEIVK